VSAGTKERRKCKCGSLENEFSSDDKSQLSISMVKRRKLP